MTLTKQTKQLIGIIALLFFCSGITYAQSNLSDDLQKTDTKKMQAKMSAVAPQKKAVIKSEADDPPSTPYSEMTPEEKLALLEEQNAAGKVNIGNYESTKAYLEELINRDD